MPYSTLVGTFAAIALTAWQTTASGAPADLCSLLAPADFQKAGVTGAKPPTVNPDEQGAYCVYAGKSAATGGVEFDVFVTKSDADAKDVYKTMLGEMSPASRVKNALPGADESELAKVAKPSAFTTITARKGKLAFAIGVPATPTSQDAVVSLARLVLQRAEKLTR